MKILIVLLGVAVAALAEPPLVLNYDYPGSYLFRYPYSSLFPGVRSVIPSVVSPYYYDGLKSNYHVQDLFGRASYGHVEPGQRHQAVQDAFGNKVGSFSYYNADGKLIQTSYIADGAGYRVTSNDLPVAPENKLVVPVDTPEVVAAREAHLKEVEAVKARSKREAPIFAPIYPIAAPLVVPQAYPTTTNFIPKVTKDGFLEETPEVIVAKERHLVEHAAAAARSTVVPPVVAPIVPSPVIPYYQRFASPLPYVRPISHSLPVVTPEGFLVDTPEVAAAKAEHLAAHRRTGLYPFFF